MQGGSQPRISRRNGRRASPGQTRGPTKPRRVCATKPFPTNRPPVMPSQRRRAASRGGGPAFAGAAARRRARVAALIQNEILDPAAQCIADPDALLESWIVHIVRLRVEDIDEVFVIDRKRYSAWHSELVPRRQVFAVLIEDLYAGIGSVAQEQAAAFVHGDAMC